MVHVRLEECKRDANLPHDVCVVGARPFLHATTGPCHFLRRVLSLCSSHAAPCRSAPRHIRHHPTIALPGRERTFFTMFLSLFQEGASSWIWHLRGARTRREATTGTCSLTRSFRAETVNCNSGLQRARVELALVLALRQRNMAMRNASRKGFTPDAALRSACLTLSGHQRAPLFFFKQGMIGKQIRSLTHTRGQAQIASSRQRRHLASFDHTF